MYSRNPNNSTYTLLTGQLHSVIRFRGALVGWVGHINFLKLATIISGPWHYLVTAASTVKKNNESLQGSSQEKKEEVV